MNNIEKTEEESLPDSVLENTDISKESHPNPILEDATLSNSSEKYFGELIKTEKQKRDLRFGVVYAAIFLICFFVVFKFLLLNFIGKYMSEVNDFFFIYASIPTVSITLIMVFLTMGVFKGFQDKDMESLVKKTPGVNQLTGNSSDPN